MPTAIAEPTTTLAPSLLARSGTYTVPFSVFAGYLGSTIVREQFAQYIGDTVKWALALFDASPLSSMANRISIADLGTQLEDYIEDRISPDEQITLNLAIAAVSAVLGPVYGRQLRVTGWLPGHRVAQRQHAVELSGYACPKCVVNPTVYRVGNATTQRCLNTDDCGWIAN